MSFTLAQLKSECQTNPAVLSDPASGLTLAQAFAQGQFGIVAAILNLVRTGTAADGKSYAVFRNDVAPKEVVQAIATVDFNASTQLQISKLELMFVAGVIDCTLSNVRANMQAIFSGASAATVTALTAVATRNGSRAEALWGTGTAIQTQDIANAV